MTDQLKQQWKKQNEEAAQLYAILADQSAPPSVRSRLLSDYLAERFAEIRERLAALHRSLNTTDPELPAGTEVDLLGALRDRIRSLELKLASERQRHQEHLDISAQRFNRIRELREQNDRLLAWKDAMLELGKRDKVRDAG